MVAWPDAGGAGADAGGADAGAGRGKRHSDLASFRPGRGKTRKDIGVASTLLVPKMLTFEAWMEWDSAPFQNADTTAFFMAEKGCAVAKRSSGCLVRAF